MEPRIVGVRSQMTMAQLVAAGLHAGDNGRVVGYDNAHDQHHRHYFGVVTPVVFVDFEDVEERFEQDWIALKDRI